MKIAIKYGLLITLVVVFWVLVTHFLFPLPPDSKVNILAPILFNFAAIMALYLGIRASAANGELSFKQGINTGMAISLVYGISSCLFFFIVFLFVGPKFMANEPMVGNVFWGANPRAGLFDGNFVHASEGKKGMIVPRSSVTRRSRCFHFTCYFP
jgi:Protein of unknown function (DUF4199)